MCPSKHLSHKVAPVRRSDGHVKRPRRSLALTAELTSVAAPLVRTCVVTGVDALALGPLGMGLDSDLDLLLLDDGGAAAGPPGGR